MGRQIEVTELILRDAHQSLMATRLATEDMVPVCEDLDKAGFWSVECWGGATYDACIRYLNEDPWERLRTFRQLMPNTRLQMLLRGQNLLGYRHYEDEVVERFCAKAAENGIDVFRIFDALNDIRNMQTAIAAVKRAGKHAQGTICYTTSPVHTIDKFVDMAEELKAIGVDSICIKDMAALLKPQPAYDLVRGIKQACGEETLVQLHCHATTGVTLVSYMKAIEAGCDIVDTSVSALSLGSGHNPTESLVEMLEGTGHETRVDLDRLRPVRKHFREVRKRYRHFMTDFTTVDTEIFRSQIPGGMISNMVNQLKDQGAGDRVDEVMEEVPRVRADCGFPPLVTPSSQIVGTQAVFNVLLGKYQAMTAEFADLMLGYYGTTPSAKNPELLVQAEAQQKKPAIEGRPADLLAPEWAQLRAATEALDGNNGSDEDVLTHAMFPQVSGKFFTSRHEGPKSVAKDSKTDGDSATRRPTPAPSQEPNGAPGDARQDPVTYVITLHGREHQVRVAPAG